MADGITNQEWGDLLNDAFLTQRRGAAARYYRGNKSQFKNDVLKWLGAAQYDAEKRLVRFADWEGTLQMASEVIQDNLAELLGVYGLAHEDFQFLPDAVVIYPASDGTLYNGVRYRISIQNPEVSNAQILATLDRYDELWSVLNSVPSRSSIIHENETSSLRPYTDLAHTIRIVDGKDGLEMQFSNDNLEYPIHSMTVRIFEDADEFPGIVTLASGLGIKPEAGQRVTGEYLIHYTLGNVKKDSRGKPAAELDPQRDYYRNVVKIERA